MNNINPVAFELFGRSIYWYGIIIACGVLVGILLAMRYAKKLGYNPDTLIDFALLAIPLAIVGARTYYVIFSWNVYRNNPADIFKIWEGGLAIFGGVFGGLIACLIFTKWRKVKFADLTDICAPSLILGQALGRWGNFLNQEAYGYEITNSSWQWFPAAVFINADQKWHMATFFYEFLWNSIVFIILMLFTKRRKKSGEVFYLYIILYSIGRFFIEPLRTDSLYFGPFRVSQLVSGILVVLGLVLFLNGRRKLRQLEAEAAVEDVIYSDIEMSQENEGDNSNADKKEEQDVASNVEDENQAEKRDELDINDQEQPKTKKVESSDDDKTK